MLCILVAVLSVPFGQYAGHRAKRSIHEGLVKTLLVLPVEQINIGQFIHRFANDVCVVDKVLWPNFGDLNSDSLKPFISENLSNEFPSSSVRDPLGQCDPNQYVYRSLVPLCHGFTGPAVLLHPALLQRPFKVSVDPDSAKRQII